MQSARDMNISGSGLKSPFPSIKGESGKETDEGLSQKLVNDEYKEVFRTQSYTDMWSKVQVQLKEPTSLSALDHKKLSSSAFSSLSSSPSHSSSCSNNNNKDDNNNNNDNDHSRPQLPLYVHLLEPCQEAAFDIIKSSNLKSLLIHYFEASLDACNLCESLLKGAHKTRSNHGLVTRALKLSSEGKGDHSKQGCLGNFTTNNQCQEIVIRDLASLARLKSPLSSIILNGAEDFHKIHDQYTLLLKKLLSKWKNVKRREKLRMLLKKTAPNLLVTFSLGVKKKASINGVKGSFVQHLATQLDEAARGAYMLINDFDTVGMLVRRVHDEYEHTRVLAETCVRNRKSQPVLKEALRDLCVHEDGFVEQLEELEEHIYLCFLTINRSRRHVIHELLSP